MFQGRRFPGAAVRALHAWTRGLPAALLALLLVAPAASAQDRFTPRLAFNGFGAMGLIHSTQSGADFVENTSQPEGAGHSSRVSASGDSRVAGQATLFVGSKFTAVVQVMVEQTHAGDYTPHAEWANISYAFTPDLSVRGGRIVMPIFLISDSRKVSFANPWVRPPVELYGMAPIFSLDGVDATYRTRLGEWTGSLNAGVGRTTSEFPSGTVEAEKVWTVNTTFVRGALTGRLAASGATLRMDVLTPLFDGFRAFGPEGSAIAGRYEMNDRAHTFATAGMEYDPGEWFTIAELGWLRSKSAIGERLAGYVTGGVRTGAVTSHATYSRTTLLSESAVAGLTLTGLPPEYAQMAAALNAGLNEFLSAAPVQQNLAIGGRWDFMPGVALKAQVDFVDILGSSYGTFINVQPGVQPGGGARLLSIATTFVF